MALSLALMMILGLLANYIFTKFKVPGLLGMILVGMLLGPSGLNWIPADNVWLSDDVKTIAMVIILLRAGLGVKREELKKVGKTAILMGFIPSLLEGLLVAGAAMVLFHFTFVQGGILGFILAAVSPALVVPHMLTLLEAKRGTQKGIPTLILAGASIDNIFAITIFSLFLGLYGGTQINLGLKLAGIPLSIVLGIVLGGAIGFFLVLLFKKGHIRDTKKVLLILGAAILLTSLEKQFKSKVEIAGLLGVMTVGFIILEKLPEVGKRLSQKFNKIWVFAEILLFIMIGTKVNVNAALHAGISGIALIGIGLLARSLGVYLCTIRTGLNRQERLFCIFSYTPKATVQAALGATPLALGVASGEIMLAIAVLAIVITSPLGAVLMQWSGSKLSEEL